MHIFFRVTCACFSADFVKEFLKTNQMTLQFFVWGQMLLNMYEHLPTWNPMILDVEWKWIHISNWVLETDTKAYLLWWWQLHWGLPDAWWDRSSKVHGDYCAKESSYKILRSGDSQQCSSRNNCGHWSRASEKLWFLHVCSWRGHRNTAARPLPCVAWWDWILTRWTSELHSLFILCVPKKHSCYLSCGTHFLCPPCSPTSGAVCEIWGFCWLSFWKQWCHIHWNRCCPRPTQLAWQCQGFDVFLLSSQLIFTHRPCKCLDLCT